MSGTVRADMPPPLVVTGSQGFENRPQPADDLGLPPDHQAVSFRPPPDAAAGPHVDKLQPALFQHRRPAKGVAIIGVPAVDDGVAAAQERHQRLQRLIDGGSRGNHQPDDARRAESFHHVSQRRGRLSPHLHGALPRLRGARIPHDAVTGAYQPLGHIGAHAAQSDHGEMHTSSPCPALRSDVASL